MQASFDDLGTPLHDVTFVVVDLETTGGSADNDAITEVGAVKVRGGELLGEFQTLVNPGREIPPTITILTGITHAMVVEAPRIDTVFPSFLEFLGDAVLVAHNARFDVGFLNAAAADLGYDRLDNRILDTVALARRVVRSEVRSLKLGSLAAHFRSPVTPNHRALEDARATTHVLHGLLERVGTLGVTGLEDLLALPTAKGAPTYHKLRLADGLPRRPGVYLFRDRSGAITYIGKATNLRSRVRSYFYGDTRRTVQTMLAELVRIDHIECPTELEASVLELRMIHEHVPRHNRRSKPPKAHHWVRLTDEAFPRLSIARTHRPDDRSALGPFRSRKAAEVVMHALWDATPVRRCTGKPGSREGVCRYAQLGVSLCPCAGTLDEGEYAEAIESILRSTEEPAGVLDPLAARMRSLAATERFEEAGWLRDRHRALRRALERRHRWQLLQEAGRVVAANADSTVVIDHGRFVTSWVGDPPLLTDPEPTQSTTTPETVAIAEELDLVWNHLTANGTELVEAGVEPASIRAAGLKWQAAEAALKAS